MKNWFLKLLAMPFVLIAVIALFPAVILSPVFTTVSVVRLFRQIGAINKKFNEQDEKLRREKWNKL